MSKRVLFKRYNTGSRVLIIYVDADKHHRRKKRQDTHSYYPQEKLHIDFSLELELQLSEVPPPPPEVQLQLSSTSTPTFLPPSTSESEYSPRIRQEHPPHNILHALLRADVVVAPLQRLQQGYLPSRDASSSSSSGVIVLIASSSVVVVFSASSSVIVVVVMVVVVDERA